jgi:HEAT repeat protein
MINQSENAFKALLKNLVTGDKFLRREAAITLGEHKDQKAIKPLIVALADEDIQVQTNAIKSLATYGEPAINQLLETVRDTNFLARTFSEVQPQASFIFSLIKNYNVGEAHKKFAKTQLESSSNSLFDNLKNKVANKLTGTILKGFDTNQNVAYALVQIGEPAVSILINALNDESSYVKEVAAKVLGKIGDKRAIPVLIDALNIKYANIKEQIAKALGKLGGEEALKVLIKLATEQDRFSDLAVAKALGEIGDRRAVDALVNLLSSNMAFTCMAAAEALGKIGDEKALPALYHVIKTNGLFGSSNYSDQIIESAQKSIKQINHQSV